MKNNYLFTVLFFLSGLFTGKTYAQNPLLIVEGDLTNVTNDYIYERERCVEKGTQLIDCSYNGSYILFDIKPTESGKYLFTSAIATKNDGIGCTIGYVDENKEFIESATLDIANTGNWSKTLDYQLVFDLEADRTYSFMMK